MAKQVERRTLMQEEFFLSARVLPDEKLTVLGGKDSKAWRDFNSVFYCRTSLELPLNSDVASPKVETPRCRDGDVVPYLMTDADESTLHARLYYVPQYKLKMLFNRVLENYTAADTYPNSSIAVNDADKFYKCVCIEAALLHYFANAMAYIDFIMHHFEPGNNRQTCADRRSIFANKMRLDGSFVTHDLPTSCVSCFIEIEIDVTLVNEQQRSDVFAYIIHNTTLRDIDVDVFEITATAHYGGVLRMDHYAALNGGDFDYYRASGS
jgi:hypothetical protein